MSLQYLTLVAPLHHAALDTYMRNRLLILLYFIDTFFFWSTCMGFVLVRRFQP